MYLILRFSLVRHKQSYHTECYHFKTKQQDIMLSESVQPSFKWRTEVPLLTENSRFGFTLQRLQKVHEKVKLYVCLGAKNILKFTHRFFQNTHFSITFQRPLILKFTQSTRVLFYFFFFISCSICYKFLKIFWSLFSEIREVCCNKAIWCLMKTLAISKYWIII